MTNKKWNWLWVWASLICYAQIYVGKHFPSDIVAGALLGMLIGTGMSKAYEIFQASKFSSQKILVRFPAKQAQNQ